MENQFDDFIIVDDDELFLGDENLNIEKNNESDDNDGKKEEEEISDDDMLIVDDEEDTLEADDDDEESHEFDDENEKKTKTKKRSTKAPKAEEQDDDDGDNGDDNNVNDSNAYTAFGQSLAEKGFFPDLDEETLATVEDEEGLSELLEKQLNTTFSQWQASYKQNLVNNLTKDGYMKKEDIEHILPEVYTEADIQGSPEIAKDVIRKYYKRTNVPDREIDRIIASRDDLEESALELNKLNEDLDRQERTDMVAKIQRDEDAAKQKSIEFNENLQKTAFEYTEFIPGRKLRKRDKEDVLRNVQPTLNKVNKDLSKYGVILSYLDKYGILDGDFSKIMKDKKSQTVKNDFQKIMEKKRASGRSGGSRQSTGSLKIDDSGTPNIYK